MGRPTGDGDGDADANGDGAEAGAALDVEDHYDRPGLVDRLLSALEEGGVDPAALDREVPAGVTEFHLRGRSATRDLGDAAGLGEGDRVVDAGAGLGGPARTLAAEYGCRVLAVDLTPSYCRAGAVLTRRLGLAGRVAHCRASATSLPVAGGAVDAVWTQHLLASLPDPDRFVAEAVRVLPRGGRLAVHEVFAGSVEPVRYPVPFATDGSVSFLVGPDRFRGALCDAGFRPVEWTDVTDEAVAWYEELFDSGSGSGDGATGSGDDAGDEGEGDSAGPVRHPGLDLVLGDRFGEMTRTMYRSLEEDRLSTYRGVFELDPST